MTKHKILLEKVTASRRFLLRAGFTASLLLVLSASFVFSSQPALAAEACPGSGAPAGTDCSTIPVGCPGSLNPNHVTIDPNQTLTCPYAGTTAGACAVKKCVVSPPDTGTTTPATPDPAATSGNCANASKCDLVSKYVNPLINFLAALVGLAVTIAIIYGGIEYASAGGDSQKISIAKNRIRNAIIALITFFFLYALLNFLIPGGLF